jgi:hypothetical protein
LPHPALRIEAPTGINPATAGLRRTRRVLIPVSLPAGGSQGNSDSFVKWGWWVDRDWCRIRGIAPRLPAAPGSLLRPATAGLRRTPPGSHPGVLTGRRKPEVIRIVEWVGMVGRPGLVPHPRHRCATPGCAGIPSPSRGRGTPSNPPGSHPGVLTGRRKPGVIRFVEWVGMVGRPGLVPHPRHRSATPGCAGIPSPSRGRGTPSNPPGSHPGVITVRRRPGVIRIVEWVGMVGRPGFEPGTNNLKGCCSTIELSTPTAPTKRGEYVSPARIGKPFFPKAMPRLTPKACDLRTPSIAYRSQSNTLFQRFTLWEQSNTSRVRRRLNACQPKLKKSL